MSVHVPTCMEHAASTGMAFIKFYIMNLVKYVTKIQHRSKWNKKIRQYLRRPM